MPRREPSWWYSDRIGPAALALAPVAWVYGAIAQRNLTSATPFVAARKVICIGNFTAGGAGKTPLTIALCKLLREQGREPWTLSRGYGGRLTGPLIVERERHTAIDVGDEPLLLAKHATAVVSRDRRAGAEYIAQQSPTNAVIVMDDGLQNPAIAKDLTLAVVDRSRGLGNGRVIPSGPLRAPLFAQLPLVDGVVVSGAPTPRQRQDIIDLSETFAGPVISAETRAANPALFSGTRVLAYAGIVNPHRFFSSLAAAGADVVATRAFADHQPYSEADAQTLLSQARTLDAALVTTEKDMARLAGATGAAAELAARSEILAVTTEFVPPERQRLITLLNSALAT